MVLPWTFFVHLIFLLVRLNLVASRSLQYYPLLPLHGDLLVSCQSIWTVLNCTETCWTAFDLLTYVKDKQYRYIDHKICEMLPLDAAVDKCWQLLSLRNRYTSLLNYYLKHICNRCSKGSSNLSSMKKSSQVTNPFCVQRTNQ